MNATLSAQPACTEPRLRFNRYPALLPMATEVPLVLIHGWGCDSRIWAPVLPLLQQQQTVITVDLPGFGSNAQVALGHQGLLLQQLLAVLPPRFTLVGWSLGGMVAMLLAEAAPERVQALITVGSNVKFVADADWPAGMTADHFDGFYQGFTQSPALGLKRFAGLEAQGDAQQRQLLRSLRDFPASAFEAANNQASWLTALDCLAQWDLRASFAALQVPGLHLYAANDALVPAAIRDHLPHNTRQQTAVIDNAGHGFFYSAPERLALAVNTFLTERRAANPDSDSREFTAASVPAQQRNKAKVAASFGRAARDYDAVAYFQRDVGEDLLRRYPLQKLIATASAASPVVLDLGCGTGYFTSQLGDRLHGKRVSHSVTSELPAPLIVGCDLAEGMTQFAQQAHGQTARWLVGDAENLPLADNSLDLVFSSLALQWCERPEALLRELWRTLRPGGHIVFSTLGPDTLKELRAAWQVVDGFVHVNQFVPAERWQQLAQNAGFELADWQRRICRLPYEKIHTLMRELKTLGAHNVNAGQPQGLTGRARLRALEQAYESFRSEGVLPATYEIYYVKLTKPATLNR